MNLQKFLFTLTAICILCCISHASTIVTDGLVSYWTFDFQDLDDGIAEDIWGENDATIKGNAMIADGHLRQGLELDGDEDYVVLQNVGNFQSQTGPSTVEFWFKTSNKSKISTLFKVIEFPCAKRGNGWGINIHGSRNGNFLFGPPPQEPIEVGKVDDRLKHSEDTIMFQTASKMGKNSCHSGSISIYMPISDGQWHHLIYVSGALYVDAIGKEWSESILYIDNIRMRIFGSSNANPTNNIPYTLPVYLGATNNNGTADRFFAGIIDELRVYNRALIHREVTQNYLSRNGLSVEPTSKLPMVWGQLKQTTY